MCVCVQWVIVSVCQWRCGCLSTTYICQPQLYGDFVFFIYFFFILSHTFTELSQPPSNLMMYERNNFEDYIQTYPIFIQWASEKKTKSTPRQARVLAGQPATHRQRPMIRPRTSNKKCGTPLPKLLTHTRSPIKKKISVAVMVERSAKRVKKKIPSPVSLGTTHTLRIICGMWAGGISCCSPTLSPFSHQNLSFSLRAGGVLHAVCKWVSDFGIFGRGHGPRTHQKARQRTQKKKTQKKYSPNDYDKMEASASNRENRERYDAARNEKRRKRRKKNVWSKNLTHLTESKSM